MKVQVRKVIDRNPYVKNKKNNSCEYDEIITLFVYPVCTKVQDNIQSALKMRKYQMILNSSPIVR